MGRELMTLEVLGLFLAVLGLLAPWIAWLTVSVMRIRTASKSLLWMHEHPHETGFGTVGMRELITANTRALRELTHYVTWSTEQQTGNTPPPYVETPK